LIVMEAGATRQLSTREHTRRETCQAPLSVIFPAT
jgi:hypothetical protein